MNISDKYRCIFIHIPKAAGTSVKQTLQLGGQGHPAWIYFAKNYPQKWRHYLRFTIVRNPWDRVVSAFSYAKMKNSYWHNPETFPHPDFETLKDKSFTECCEMLVHQRNKLRHEAWHPQYAWLLAKQGEQEILAVNKVLHFETLDKDFAELCKTLNAEFDELPEINPSKRSHYKDYYDEHTRTLISQVYAKDIEIFGYKFD